MTITPLRRRVLSALAVLAVTATTLVGATTNPATATFKPRWTGTWATALTTASATNTNNSLAGFDNQSIRMIARVSVGGEKVRIRLTNEYGSQPLEVGRASIGVPVAAGSPDLVPGSVRELTFRGSGSVTVYKGADTLSDPVDMKVPALSEVAVTVYLSQPTGPTSWHWVSRQTSYVYAGDRAADPSGDGHTASYGSFYFLAGVDVASRTAHGSVVVLGDSISDGFGSTQDASNRWPDELAERIVATFPHIGDPGVLNQALSGNRVARDGAFLPVGTSGLARLNVDVYSQTGVRSVIVELGINDIHFDNDTPERIIRGLRELAAQLRGHGLRVLVCTLMPFEGYPTWTPEKEATRLAVNEYLRGSKEFDAVLDMDKVLRDPAAPSKLKPEFDSGDHIHPNDAGAQAMAAAVPLWLL